MSLKDQAARELQSWGTFHDAARTLDVADAGNRLRSELTALDVLGCAFERLAVESQRLAAASMDDLKAISTQLSSRLTYLLEPISPVEIDADRCVVQMRSNPPHKDEHKTSYYELVVRRGGEIVLCRYVKEPGDARHTVPACVTREVFLRLIGDFELAMK
jgi:hypothetical protein